MSNFQTSLKQLPRMSPPPKHQMSLPTTVALWARMPRGSRPPIGILLQYMAVGGAGRTCAEGSCGSARRDESTVVEDGVCVRAGGGTSVAVTVVDEVVGGGGATVGIGGRALVLEVLECDAASAGAAVGGGVGVALE